MHGQFGLLFRGMFDKVRDQCKTNALVHVHLEHECAAIGIKGELLREHVDSASALAFWRIICLASFLLQRVVLAVLSSTAAALSVECFGPMLEPY
jgi:hypothetical protein